MLFSIYSVLVESEAMPHCYQNFIYSCDKSQHAADLTIKQTVTPHCLQKAIKITELPQINIWRRTDDDSHQWIFEAWNGAGTVATDKDYNNAELYYSEIASIIVKKDIIELFSPILQILIQCKLIQKGCAILHAACVRLNNNAYAFTGPSGIGKSSRAWKWCEILSAVLISGDRPIIDAENRIASGAPWDGKETIYHNINCRLATILKVRRSTDTKINLLSYEDKLSLLSNQTFIPLWDTKLAAKAMHVNMIAIGNVPIYELQCDITNESTIRSYEILLDTIE